VHKSNDWEEQSTSPLSLHGSMKQFTAEQKHEILLEYTPHSHSHSFPALALRHAVSGGGDRVRKWHNRWNRTVTSLQHKSGGGRPRVLSRTQVTRHITAPIRNSNRAGRVVRYSKLLPRVREATGTDVSLRTLSRYGREEAGGRETRGKKRTSEECEIIKTLGRKFDSPLIAVYSHPVSMVVSVCDLQCLPSYVSRSPR
jgi:hypothetical protein